jgi:uncharacterized protein (DUF1800 family)
MFHASWRGVPDGRRHGRTALLCVSLLVVGCGGGHEADSPSADGPARMSSDSSADGARMASLGASKSAARMGQADAVRLAQQASFGPSEVLIDQIQRQGAVNWIKSQMTATGSSYTSGGDDRIHTNTSPTEFCQLPAHVDDPDCRRDFFSHEPLTWDFYRNAVHQPDQLRQRVALALQQVLVVSAVEIDGTYGLRRYHNMLLNSAFGNYRYLLRQVTRSPVMGDYLDHVNNDRVAPNENYARELLQLFSLGPCRLLITGELEGGKCRPTYDNTVVRNYAFALTGWTYPAGGKSWAGCWPQGANCVYYDGDMASVAALHDTRMRNLLSGITVPGGSTTEGALNKVLDSLMAHPNIAPFVAKRLIQHLVMSDPSPDYVERVARTFNQGRYVAAGDGSEVVFGVGVAGDLAATVAAVLLDDAARYRSTPMPRTGHMRSPILLFTGAIRALNGDTDGGSLGWGWGETLRQHVFRPPSVFSYYPTDYPVAGTRRIGPEFGIHNSNGALNRLNYLSYLLDNGGSAPDPSIPHAVGTRIRANDFQSDAPDAGVLVDRLANIVIGRPLAATPRAKVIEAVEYWNTTRAPSDWKLRRVNTAAYLVLASPDYQVQP